MGKIVTLGKVDFVVFLSADARIYSDRPIPHGKRHNREPGQLVSCLAAWYDFYRAVRDERMEGRKISPKQLALEA